MMKMSVSAVALTTRMKHSHRCLDAVQGSSDGCLEPLVMTLRLMPLFGSP